MPVINFFVGLIIFTIGIFAFAYIISVLGQQGDKFAVMLVGYLAIATHYVRQGILEVLAFITKRPSIIQLAKEYRRNRKYKIINRCHRFLEAYVEHRVCPHCGLHVPDNPHGEHICINCRKYFDEVTQAKAEARANRNLDEIYDRRIKYLQSQQEDN